MRVLGCEIGAPTAKRLERWRRASPTYDHVGSTLLESTGPSRQEFHLDIGRGREDFGAAVQALETFVPQRAVGAAVAPVGAQPALDETLLLSVGVGPCSVLVPTRVVAVVDEPARRGHAYGTLPGHPETGEELFLVQIADDGTVTFTIRIDAEPIRQLRLVAPVIGLVQRLATRRYLSSVATSVTSARTS